MLHVAVALLPVLVFLELLVLLDSFKLVSLRSVLATIAAGVVAALAALLLHRGLTAVFDVELRTFSRYVAPVTEELIKSSFVILLLRRQRIGFLVDAAIRGFAIGAGFSMVENVEYLRQLAGADMVVWVVRGFGTAVMHGSTTAMFAIVVKDLGQRFPRARLRVLAAGWLAAMLPHSAYNHFFLPAQLTTALLLVALPLLMAAVFEHSERATRGWLADGFDSDLELLQRILAGQMDETRIGTYLRSLQARFAGPVVGDMLCLLRIYLELTIRAKGILLAREAGLDATAGEDVADNLRELRYLEREIGKTGLLALRPLRRQSDRDLWQIGLLGG